MERREFLQAGLAAVLSSSLGADVDEAIALTDQQLDLDQVTNAQPGSSSDAANTLWYDKPARQWLEALPIGNGRLGAMVYGGVPQETLQLNEGTLWAGGPHDYTSPEGLEALPEIRRLVFAGEWHKAQDMVNSRFLGRPAGQMPFQTVGNLTLKFADSTPVTDYRRELDLDSAIARTSYKADGIRYSREAFASVVDQIIVLRLTADQPGKLTFALAYDSPQKSQIAVSGPNTLTLTGVAGDANGLPGSVRFQALACILNTGGTLHAAADHLSVTGADSVTILVSIATSYNDYRSVTGDERRGALNRIDAAARTPYARLRNAHLVSYRRLYRRVSLSLGSGNVDRDAAAANRPTNERLADFKTGNDPQLNALHFQYGRYLLISCSQLGGQPATLQGLWNDRMSPPWGSKYTININTEMNYWPAATTNLIECYAPLFTMLRELAVAGQRSAKGLYGARGWMCHHNTDAWRGSAPVDGAFWGMWPTGGAWLCKSLWDHYEFTHDRSVLVSSYPILKGATEFFLDTLVEDPQHRCLVTCPSVSPENAHHPDASICAGPTMDMQILRDLFSAVAHASEILGCDPDLRTQVLAARERLAPMRIGKQGQLQEWQEDWDSIAPEQQHRHVSHLYGLFPSSQITRRGTPELFAAARKSLETRGDMATGWSLAWKINLWARLEDGNRAYKLLTNLLTPERTAPNLFDLHPPFQIDGNFGAVSGIAEMLLQSHAGEIHLLPALPNAWPTGSVTGLRARGGYVVDMKWQQGKLTQVDIHTSVSGSCQLRYGEFTTKLATQAGKNYILNGSLHTV